MDRSSWRRLLAGSLAVTMLARVGRLMVDVRALRAAEARSRASEAVLKEAQQLAQLGSWSWDLTSDEMTWSQELYRIFGLRPEEQNAGLDRFRRLLHPDDRQRVVELLERARTAGTGFACEHRVVRSDGTVRVLQARCEVHADGAGRPVTMVGTAQDVTDRTRVQEAAQRLAAIVQSSSDAIYSLAADGTVTSWTVPPSGCSTGQRLRCSASRSPVCGRRSSLRSTDRCSSGPSPVR